MGFDGIIHALGMTCQVFFLDLILSGDNAVLIALACRRLPVRQMRQVILIGTGFAFFLRVLLTTAVTFLLHIPSLRIIGGLALIYIALKLLVDDNEAPDLGKDEGEQQSDDSKMWNTVGVVIVADLVMSMDNVVALAAAVGDHIGFLIFGLLLSVPLLMYGSLFVTGLLKRYPILVPGVAALLGWIAGDIAAADPLIANWINTQSPALTVVMPLLCAIFVLLQSRLLKDIRPALLAADTAKTGKPGFATRMLAAGEETGDSAAKPPTTPTIDAPVSTSAASEALIQDHAQNSGTELEKDEPAAIHMPVASEAETVDAAEIITSPAANMIADTAPAQQAVSQTVRTEKNSPGGFAAMLALLKAQIVLFGAVGIILVVIFVVTVFGKSFIPAPSPLTRYECPGYSGRFSLYYKHGGEQVQIRAGGRVINGFASYGKLQWENTPQQISGLGFTPPDEVNSETAKTIQINGGSFRQIMCTRSE